jgi:hypothetical protein
MYMDIDICIHREIYIMYLVRRARTIGFTEIRERALWVIHTPSTRPQTVTNSQWAAPILTTAIARMRSSNTSSSSNRKQLPLLIYFSQISRLMRDKETQAEIIRSAEYWCSV